LHYLEALKDPRWEDWEFTRSEQSINRFTYLGNGHSSVEALGGDLSYYIRNKDDSPIDPILKRVNTPDAPAQVKIFESS
jgi:cyclohexanone monooxygenase